MRNIRLNESQLPRLSQEEENDFISIDELEKETLEELENKIREFDMEYDCQNTHSKENKTQQS